MATRAAGVPRLFDLVRVREGKLRPAFYFALRNTLVAKDLDQASRIAYGHGGKWARVVTMQVHITDSSVCSDLDSAKTADNCMLRCSLQQHCAWSSHNGIDT